MLFDGLQKIAVAGQNYVRLMDVFNYFYLPLVPTESRSVVITAELRVG